MNTPCNLKMSNHAAFFGPEVPAQVGPSGLRGTEGAKKASPPGKTIPISLPFGRHFARPL